MKTSEFFRKFANTPIDIRFKPLFKEEETFTLNKLYDRINRLEDKMRPLRIEQNELLDIAEEMFKKI